MSSSPMFVDLHRQESHGAVTNGEAQRVQLRRTKGWRMPANTVSVARPTMYGNPYRIKPTPCNGPGWFVVDDLFNVRPLYLGTEKTEAARIAVEAFKAKVPELFSVTEIRAELAGKNLACWCPPGQACHADVLLRIANE